ncbi:MAG: HEAT repeat domain-containing protein [Planctomycetota bacterium]
MTLAATLLLSLAPQVFPGGDIKLPPKKPTAAEQRDVRPVGELERFRRDLVDVHGPRVKVEAKLEEMGRAYPNIERLILEVARTARENEMEHLMPVARRFGRTSGTSRVADELLFQLLARRLGSSTRAVVETMAALKGAEAKAALKQCVRAAVVGVRRHAVEVLAPLCTQADVDFALQLSREQSLDLRLRGVDLLERMGGEAAVGRLVELLAKDPALAAASCRALIGVGPSAAPALQARVAAPVVDRSFAYAAFALAQIGANGDGAALPASLQAPLVKRLRSPEALTRALVAVPLADLVYVGGSGDEVEATPPALDRALVDALLLVVEPKQFVPNIDMLRAPSEQRLRRHTGRVATATDPLSWGEWWDANRASFLGVRAQLDVTDQSAGGAVVTLRQQQRVVRILGEHMAGRAVDPDAIEVLLPVEEMAAFVRGVMADGFGDPATMQVEGGLPLVRSLDVRLAGGRSSVAVTERPHPAFDQMVAAVDAVVAAELWQLYRIVADEPDRAATWRAERAWRAAHPDELERGRRLIDRVVRGWQGWTDSLRARAIGAIAEHPRRKELLTEAQGVAMLTALRDVPQLGPFDLQLLEVAASVPGDRVWRECVELAITADGGGREAVQGVFQVLGPDAVLSALGDARALVRRAAVDEVVSARDLRAAPQLIQMLGDAEFDVQRAAVFAVGHLAVTTASRPLVDLIVAEDTDAQLRREALRALGKVGGPLAFPVLQRAMQAPGRADKEAAMRGLGELRDPRSAQLLAEFVVVGDGKPFGELAKFNLQRLGGVLVAPALHKQIPLVQDERVRADLVLLLGLYQDRDNVPELMDLLRQTRYAGEAAPRLESATGVDLTNAPDRITAIEAWWRAHKDEAQWQWLLEALREAGVPHELTPADFGVNAGLAGVPELCRLMVELETPRLWVLTAAVLRGVAGKDYGGVTMQTPPDIREGIAGRYRSFVETERAAGR